MTSLLEQALQEAQEAAVAKVKKARKPRKVKTISPEESGEKSLGQAFEEADQDGTDEPVYDEEDPIVTAPGESLIETVEKERKVKKPKTKKAAPKKAPAKTKKAPSKGKAPKRRKATQAQLKAAKNKLPRRNWVKDIENFRKAKHNNLRIEMGSPGSAQVTKVRLEDWAGFKGLIAFTKGKNLFISKLKLADAKAAAKKAGKA